MSLWGEYIDIINDDGVFIIRNIKVKSYMGKYLSSTSDTLFYKSEKGIKSIAPASTIKVLKFPAETVYVYNVNYACKRCSRIAYPLRDKFVSGSNPTCGTKSLLESAEKRVFAKLSFNQANTICIVALHHVNIVKFCDLLTLDVTNTDGVEAAMLKDNTLSLAYNEENCVVTDVYA